MCREWMEDGEDGMDPIPAGKSAAAGLSSDGGRGGCEWWWFEGEAALDDIGVPRVGVRDPIRGDTLEREATYSGSADVNARASLDRPGPT